MDVITDLNRPTSIAFRGDYMYISENRKITKINLYDDDSILEDVYTDLYGGNNILIDGNDLYIALYTGGKVIKMDLSADNPIPEDVVTNVYGSTGMFIKDDILYIAEATQDKISKVDLTAATPTATDYITGLGFPNALFVKDDILYFNQLDHDKISKVNITEPKPTPIDIVTNLDTPSLGLLLIEDELYFSQYGNNKVSKININDINPTVIDVTIELDAPAQLVLHNNELFIAVSDDNKIVKLDSATLSNQEIQIQTNTNISLHPNPILNSITINGLDNPQNGVLFNALGAKVSDFIAQENMTIDLQHLASGIYYIVLENGWSQKVIKQ